MDRLIFLLLTGVACLGLGIPLLGVLAGLAVTAVADSFLFWEVR